MPSRTRTLNSNAHDNTQAEYRMLKSCDIIRPCAHAACSYIFPMSRTAHCHMEHGARYGPFLKLMIYRLRL